MPEILNGYETFLRSHPSEFSGFDRVDRCDGFSFEGPDFRVPRTTDVLELLNGYTNTFYYVSGTNGYFRSQQASSTTTYFWQFANEIQSVEDAYLLTGNTVYQGMITNLLNGFLNYAGSNCSYNDHLRLHRHGFSGPEQYQFQ